MTEREWLSATEPQPLLDYLYPLRGHDSVESQSRMSRLYLLACARSGWDRLPGACRTVVSLTEQVYKARKTNRALKKMVYPLAEELLHCRGAAEAVNSIATRLRVLDPAIPGTPVVQENYEPDLWIAFASLAYLPLADRMPCIGCIPKDLHSVDLVREIFGNPLAHYPPFENAWRTETVTLLARQALETHDFSSLPVLADALEDAGCFRDDVLDHFRRGGSHTRGCWALDLVLD